MIVPTGWSDGRVDRRSSLSPSPSASCVASASSLPDEASGTVDFAARCGARDRQQLEDEERDRGEQQDGARGRRARPAGWCPPRPRRRRPRCGGAARTRAIGGPARRRPVVAGRIGIRRVGNDVGFERAIPELAGTRPTAVRRRARQRRRRPPAPARPPRPARGSGGARGRADVSSASAIDAADAKRSIGLERQRLARDRREVRRDRRRGRRPGRARARSAGRARPPRRCRPPTAGCR